MDTEGVVLELFVQGQSPTSSAAVEVVHRVCESHFGAQYRLDVIDIRQQPERTRAAGIVATPALIRRSPAPVMRMTGRFTDARVLSALGLPTQHA